MTSRLADLLVRIEAGKSFGAAARPAGDEEWGIVKVSAMTWGEFRPAENKVVTDTGRVDPRYEICPRDVLISRANTAEYVGAPVLVRNTRPRLLLSDKSLRLVPRAGVDPAYLHAIMSAPQTRKRISARATGTKDSMRNISQSALLQLEVPPLPPLDEQQRIVDLLEDHLSRLDAADAYLRSTCQRLIGMERSALERLFGRTEVPLADLISGISAGKSFGGASVPAGDDEWGIIKVSAMTWGAFNPSENKAVPGDRADARFEVREGDLLVSRANTGDYVGASVLVGSVRPRLLLSDKSLRVSAAPGVRPEWLWRALQAPSARRQMSAMATGTKASMKNISQESLKRVRVPRASSEEQAAAVANFAEVETVVGRLRTELHAARTHSRALRRSLLAAAFTGQLTASSADLPVAEELFDA